MKATRIGIIGYGYWGPNLARNLFDLISAELVAIADVNPESRERAQARYPLVRLVIQYQELFELGLDAVVVATPPKTHYAIARDCLLNNLHVLVEKPMTMTASDAEELIRLADSKGLTLMVGHTFIYNNAVRSLQKYVQSGELGDIYYVDAARLNLGLFQRDSNVLWDLAPHDISILLALLGQKPLSVSAQGMPCVFEGIYDVVYVNLIFPNNVPAYLHISWLDPCKVRRITIVGSKKMAVFNDMENENKIRIYDKGVDTPVHTNGSFAEFQCSYHSGDIIIPHIQFAEPLRQECQHFIDCIANHTEPSSSGRDGWDVVKILEAAQRSLTNGSKQEEIQWEIQNVFASPPMSNLV